MKSFDAKKLLLVTIPIAFVIFLVFFFIGGKKEISNGGEKQTSSLFVPDAKEELVPEDKVSAYKQYEQNKLDRQREIQASQVKGSDFFKDMGDDDRWSSGQVRRDTMSAEDLYEEVVIRNGGGKKNYDQIAKNKELQKNLAKEELNKTLKQVEKINIQQEQTEGNIFTTADGRRARRSTTQAGEGGSRLILACIHGDQEVTLGGVVRMRLLEAFSFSDVTFPENTLFYGTAQISQDRMQIRVESLKIGEKLIPVACVIYDNDAIVGLNLPDNIKNELAQRTKQGAIDGINIPVGGGDVISSAISTVASATKSVIRQKESQIKVYLKANYKIFIKQM